MNIFYKEKKEFFKSTKTSDIDFRIEMLKRLRTSIKKYEEEILLALYEDLHKPRFEAYTSELGVVYKEISHAIKNLRKWSKPKKVSTPLFLQPGKSYIYPQAKGIVLIISPWNYPFQLVFNPLVGAIAAGNCCLVKPSNKAKNTESLICKIIKESFDPHYISSLTGPGSKTIEPILDKYAFDHIFFTGSARIGKKIMAQAAKHLSPLSLELGRKSPAIVMPDTNLKLAAKRVVWGKFYNAGQTCVAPDYVLIHQKSKEKFINYLKEYIKKFYCPLGNRNISRIINKKHFGRLVSYLDNGDILYGGHYNERDLFIAPTLISPFSLDEEIMNEEIFGPILPIIGFENLEESLKIVERNPHPLALYLFTKNKKIESYIINRLQFGGGCINNTLNHFVNPNLPFGGIGRSGFGQYHSKYTFDLFSHKKSILKSPNFELDLKYPPYNKRKIKIAKKLLK